MFRGGRGGNRRPFDKPYDPSLRGKNRRSGGHKRDFNNTPDGKSEWVSYKRQNPQEKTDKPDAIENTKLEEVTVKPENVAEKVNPPADHKIQTEDNTEKRVLEHAPDTATTSSDRLVTPGRYVGKPGEKKFSGRCRLFVANMNNSTTENELRGLFSEFGETGELFINKEKGFGFIRMDYRHNAELAKSSLDKKSFKGRVIQVRFATHASAIELHGLDEFASNEYIEKTMSQFGTVERAVVVCDDRGRSKGHAIVEFEWKKTAQKVLDRFKEEMFVLGRLPKPIFAKPRSQQDEEDGLHEQEIERHPALKSEREFTPRFISPSSFEYTWAKKWRDLFIEEEDKKAKLDQELHDSRYALEMEMESALREQEAVKIREGMIAELQRRQEELHRIEEDMRIRQEMNQRAREQLDRNRANKAYEDNNRRNSFPPRHPQAPMPPPRDNQMMNPPPRNHQEPFTRNEGFPNDISRQNEFIMQQQAELEMRRGELLRAAGVQPGMLGLRPEMLPPGGLPMAGGLGGLQPQNILAAGLPGTLPPGPRGPPGMQQQMHSGQQQRQHIPEGPPPRRDFSPRGGDRFDNHKRPRRD